MAAASGFAVGSLEKVTRQAEMLWKMWRPDGEGPFATLLSWQEIAAGMLVAFLDRAAARDAWDVTRLVSRSPRPWPPPDLRGLFVALAGTLPRPLHEYGRR